MATVGKLASHCSPASTSPFPQSLQLEEHGVTEPSIEESHYYPSGASSCPLPHVS